MRIGGRDYFNTLKRYLISVLAITGIILPFFYSDWYTCIASQSSYSWSPIVLSGASPNIVIQSGNSVEVYGTSDVNNVTLKKGAEVVLRNFPGKNRIIFESDTENFIVYRDGAMVTFEGDDATYLEIPATNTPQSIEFQNVEMTLIINRSQVLLDEQVITLLVNTIEHTDDIPPTANIDYSLNNSTHESGYDIVFNGSGYDSEDGNLSGSSLVWRSSIDGHINTGTYFTKNNLSIGTHTITLTVTDSQGQTDSDQVTITILGVASIALNVKKFGQGTISDDTSDMNCFEANCTILYDLDQMVQLSASPESGWQLNQWSGCDSVSNNICTVTMREEKMVFATFERTAPPVLENNVIILSSETVSQITSIQDGAIIFSSDATDMAIVPVGTILVSTVGEGFARKVTDVIALQGSTTTISTTNVPLDEIIGEGTLIFNSQLTNNDLSSVKSVKGIALRKSARAMSPTFTFDVDVEVEDGVHVKGAVELQIVPDFALDIGWTGVQEFKTAAQFTVKPSISVSVVVASSDQKKLKKEITLPISLKFAPIILGPVVLIPEVDALLTISVDAKVSVTMDGWVKVDSKAGAHYLKSVGWKAISDFSVDGSFKPLDIKGEASAQVMVGPKFAVKIYGVAGPSLYVGPYVKGDVAYKIIENCGEWAIKAGAKGVAKVEGGVLGWKIKALEMNLYDKSWKLAGDSFGECTDTEAPSTPGTPVVSKSLPTSLHIEWSPSTDNTLVEKYEVYRDYNKIGETTSPLYFDNGLSPDTEYCYYIIAVDSNNNKSDESNAGCGTTKPEQDNTPPSTPTGLTAEMISTSAIELNWQSATDNDGDVSYLIFKSGENEIITGTESLSVSITHLKPTTEYCFQVAAIDEAGNISDLSDSVCATTNSVGIYRMRVKCESSASYAVDTGMDLDENVTNSVSVVGNANDYGGTPMAYVLSGIYVTDTGQLNGRIDWSFEGNDCSRADTFSVDLTGNDTGDVTMNQVTYCGCTAQIRITKEETGSALKSATKFIQDKFYTETLSGN